MTGTRLAYFLWVRWSSGAVDRFQITKSAYLEWKTGGTTSDKFTTLLGSCFSLETPTGEEVFVRCKDIAAHKLLVKRIHENPLNDDEHYDNPLS
jgi:hypothetical protein